jgi:hypothetical protein
MSKLISFAGVSRVNGELKFRTAVSPARITQLQKLGDTDVEMRFLNVPMTKSEAAKRLIAINFANDRADVLALLVSVANDDNPFKAPKAKKPKTVKVTVPTKFAQELLGSKVTVEPDYSDPKVKLSPKQAAKIRAEFMKKLKAAYEAN